jgi:hypothetical protein
MWIIAVNKNYSWCPDAKGEKNNLWTACKPLWQSGWPVSKSRGDQKRSVIRSLAQ